MKKLHVIFIVFVLVFTSCSTSKSTVTDKDSKLKNKTTDYYKETMEEAYENLILEKEKKASKLSNKKNNNFENDDETLVATSKVKVTKEVVINYINKFRAIAIDNMNNYNIPASITLAQGILESGCGTSTLSISANNHFGIKCHANWEGESVTHTDDAPDECFRKYKNPRDSYRDHSLFLTSRKWYEPLFELDIKDYKSWSYGLKKSGYATDPNYPQKLISLIERYELNQYDNFYEVNSSNVKKTVIQENIENKELVSEKPIEVNATLIEKNPKTESTIDKNIVSKKDEIKKESNEIKDTNTKNSKTHTVEKGDTVYNISKRYNISIEKLRKINNLVESNISLGQVLIVE
jgi:flagellum-specific peptidoglycan hydrolase FlgJ